MRDVTPNVIGGITDDHTPTSYIAEGDLDVSEDEIEVVMRNKCVSPVAGGVLA